MIMWNIENAGLKPSNRTAVITYRTPRPQRTAPVLALVTAITVTRLAFMAGFMINLPPSQPSGASAIDLTFFSLTEWPAFFFSQSSQKKRGHIISIIPKRARCRVRQFHSSQTCPRGLPVPGPLFLRPSLSALPNLLAARLRFYRSFPRTHPLRLRFS